MVIVCIVNEVCVYAFAPVECVFSAHGRLHKGLFNESGIEEDEKWNDDDDYHYSLDLQKFYMLNSKLFHSEPEIQPFLCNNLNAAVLFHISVDTRIWAFWMRIGNKSWNVSAPPHSFLSGCNNEAATPVTN